MAARKDSSKIALVKRGKGAGSGSSHYELTKEQKEEMGKKAAYLSLTQIADSFGIDINTFRDLRDRDEELDRLVKQGLANKIMKYGELLEGRAEGTNISGDTAAIVFYMKTRGGYRTADSIEQIAEGNTEKYYPAEIKEKYARMIELDKICAFLTLDEAREAIKQYTMNKR